MGKVFSWKDCYAGFVNLEHRKDRLAHMVSEFARVGVFAERFDAIDWRKQNWDTNYYGTMLRRTPGAIGCYLSQMGVMKKALEQNKSAIVFEDDLIFCSDFKERLDYIENYINDKAPDFDVFWLGGTFHVNPPYWHTGRNPMLTGTTIGKDAECTDDARIMRTYGCFSTHAYIVNVKNIDKVLGLLEGQIPTSIGIDYSFIRLQPQLKTFSFVPGCVKQMDNMSDIGSGMTIYSGFSRLNGSVENSAYWWQDRMEDFDPEKFNWNECKK